MKKILTLATAALLITGVTFAGSNFDKERRCCKRESKKECKKDCKKDKEKSTSGGRP